MTMLSGIIKTTEEDPTTGEFPQMQLAQIRRDGGTQPREGINAEHVANMVATLEGGGSLPAIEVMYDGIHYWLINGFHRCAAYEKHGTDHFSVIVKQGTLEDAKWESLGANRELPRTQREIERNCKDALRHSRSQGMSNRALAAHLGVDHKTVGKYRSEMQAVGEIPQLTKRTGTDGKSYGASKERSQPVYEPVWSLEEQLKKWLIHRAAQGDKKSPSELLGLARAGGNVEVELLDIYLKKQGLAWKKSCLDVAIINVRSQLTVKPTIPPASLHPLTVDEAISLVWRVVKERPTPMVSQTTRWGIYLGWLHSHEQIKDYEHQVPEGRMLTKEVLWTARATILGELERNLEHQAVTEQRPEGTRQQHADVHQLTLDEGVAIIRQAMEQNCPEAVDRVRLAWLQNHRMLQDYRPAMADNAMVAPVLFGQAWRTVYDEVADRLNNYPEAAQKTPPPPAPASVRLSAHAEVPADGRTRVERIDGLISMLETALTALDHEYGELTGQFTHVLPAKRALEPLIGQLKIELTRQG